MASRSADVYLFVVDATPAQLQAFDRVPGVAATGIARAVAVVMHGAPNLLTVAAVGGSVGTVVDRARIVAGRAADPSALDEITIGEGLAAALHVGRLDQLGEELKRAVAELARRHHPGRTSRGE